jgi:hypothetical protein
MARREAEFDLPSSSATEALAVAAAAMQAIGWEVEAGDSGVTGIEDQARLCCHDSPVQVKITAAETASGSAVLRVETKVAGFGPLASRSLSTRIAALERALRKQQAAPADAVA